MDDRRWEQTKDEGRKTKDQGRPQSYTKVARRDTREGLERALREVGWERFGARAMSRRGEVGSGGEAGYGAAQLVEVDAVVVENPADDLDELGGAEDGVAGGAGPDAVGLETQVARSLAAGNDKVAQGAGTGLRLVVALGGPRVSVGAGHKRVVAFDHAAQPREVDLAFDVAQVAYQLRERPLARAGPPGPGRGGQYAQLAGHHGQVADELIGQVAAGRGGGRQ